LKTVGRFSDGIRIAFREGFTSGVMLDYVYRNEPSGRWLIGRWIDRAYLRHAGWESIRVRKKNLETLVMEALAVQRARGRSPVVVDVASGPARYLLDVLCGSGMGDVRAACRDLEERSLEMGRRNAAERGIANVRFERGDALDADSLAQVRPIPNVAISSGFYDWIVDDGLVRRSMLLLHDLLPEGGGFVFTNQSGHVDLAMVEGVFVDFRGEPLRMKVRPTDEMNRWAADAGFRIVRTLSDANGYYSVTLAEKMA